MNKKSAHANPIFPASLVILDILEVVFCTLYRLALIYLHLNCLMLQYTYMTSSLIKPISGQFKYRAHKSHCTNKIEQTHCL